MNEYLMDIEKNQAICVRSLHNKCGCYQCRMEKQEKSEDSGMKKFNKVLFWLSKWVNAVGI